MTKIEKAHPEVFNVLLQVLDDGRLTDGQGRTVDFKNTVLIMTSNVGSDAIREHSVLGFRAGIEGQKEHADEMKRTVLEALRNHFRPEFLNRLDEIIVFNSLSEEHIKAIVDIQVKNLKKRLAERNIDIELTDAAKSVLAKIGYDPTYGARPLKRAIQREIQDKLALMLLEGKFKEGDKIIVDADKDGKLFFEHAGETVAAI